MPTEQQIADAALAHRLEHARWGIALKTSSGNWRHNGYSVTRSLGEGSQYPKGPAEIKAAGMTYEVAHAWRDTERANAAMRAAFEAAGVR